MNEFKRVTILLTPEQYAALRDEATRRAARAGGKPDASVIVRMLVDAWRKRRAR